MKIRSLCGIYSYEMYLKVEILVLAGKNTKRRNRTVLVLLLWCYTVNWCKAID